MFATLRVSAASAAAAVRPIARTLSQSPLALMRCCVARWLPAPGRLAPALLDVPSRHASAARGSCARLVDAFARLATRSGQVGSALAELVWPPRCAACREPTAVEPFCPDCVEAILPVPGGCGRCGLPGPDPVCGPCLAHPPAFSAVAAAGLFGGPLADAVHALKYGDRPAIARPLGAWLAERVALPPRAAILSVPLGRRRRIERGYDQAALLADELALAAGREGDRLRGALLRIRETPPQVGRGRAERARNVRRAFWATCAVEGREVALVDDVVTTGATADAAARALLDAGAARVTVVALARAE